MHKFFCNYYLLTEKYELAQAKGLMVGKVATMAENTLLPEIRNLMQELYTTLTAIKEIDKTEERQDTLDQTELLLSNLFYSLFSTPLDLKENDEKSEMKALYQKGILLASEIEKLINIPEYNRSIGIIKTNLQNIFNALT